MPTSDGPSRFPVFVAPPHGNHQRCPGYVPGRVAPVRSPPPSKAPPPPPLKLHGSALQQQTTFSLSEENQHRGRAQSLQQRKNTLICFGVSLGAFFLTLILVLSLKSGHVLDGQYQSLFFCLISFCDPALLNLPHSLFMHILVFLSASVMFTDCFLMFTENCPDHNPSLSSWNPGHHSEKAVVVKKGNLFRLDFSATVHSLTIQSGGKQIIPGFSNLSSVD